MDLNLGRRKEQKKIKLGSISLKWLSFPSYTLKIGTIYIFTYKLNDLNRTLKIGTIYIFTYKLNDLNRFPKLYE